MTGHRNLFQRIEEIRSQKSGLFTPTMDVGRFSDDLVSHPCRHAFGKRVRIFQEPQSRHKGHDKDENATIGTIVEGRPTTLAPSPCRVKKDDSRNTQVTTRVSKIRNGEVNRRNPPSRLRR